MANRVIDAVLRLTDNFTTPAMKSIQAMTSMSKAGIRVGKDIEKAGESITKVGAGMTAAITMPLVGVATAAVKTAADFESSMSNVHAIMGDTYDDSLAQFAQQLGATTAWSAQEVAQAMQYTGMAGWTAKENMEGLKGILDLASASGTDLARTSDIVTDTISAFGDTAADSGRYADVMTKACTSANVSVETLGESYKYVGSLAGSMGYELDQVTTALAVMGNQGIKGSEAGTALRTAISNLAAPSKDMAAGMKALGISLTNQDGSMKSFEELIHNIQNSFQGLTADQQAMYAKQIFGKNAMSGMLSIINTSAEAYNQLGAAIDASGGAADQAAKTQLDNLNGQITLLKSALEGAAITLGNKLLPYIRKGAEYVQKLMDRINGLSDAQVDNIIKWAGIAAAVGPAIMLFGKVVKTVGTAVRMFNQFGVALKAAHGIMGLIASPVGIVVAALTATALAAVLVAKNWDKVKPVLEKVKATFMSVLPQIKSAVSNVINAIMPMINTLIDAFKEVLPKAIDVAKRVFAAMVPVINTVVGTIKTIVPIIARTFVGVAQKLKPIVVTIGSMIKAAIPIVGKLFAYAFTFVGNTIAKIMPFIQRIANVIGNALTYAIKSVSPVIQKMAETFSTVFTTVYNIASSVINKVKPVFNAIGTIIKAVMAVVKAEITAAFTIAANVIETEVGSIKTIIDGVVKVFNGVLDFISGVFTGNWRKAWEGVKGIFGGCFEALGGLCKVPINAVIGLINSAIEGINSISVDIPDGIPLVGGKHIGFSIPKIPALAVGTPDWVGGLAQVNERGGEIIDLPKGSRVYPHDDSLAMARREGAQNSGSASVMITGNTFNVRSDADIEAIGNFIVRKLKKANENRGGWTFSGNMA